MGIISWLILGLIAGFIGSKIVNSSGQGLWLDIALGIVGAIVGGVLFSAVGVQGVTGMQHLEHDRCRHWLCRSALGLSCGRRTSLMYSSCAGVAHYGAAKPCPAYAFV